MNEPIHIISFGAGVQSSTMALMAKAGQLLPLPRYAIFADTQAEPEAVYKWEKKMKADMLPIELIEVTAGDLAEDGLTIHTSKKSGLRYIKSLIPAFVLQPGGEKGLLGRKCTADYKVKVIIRRVKQIIGKKAVLAWRRKYPAELKALTKFEKEAALVKAHNKGLAKKDRKPMPDFPFSAWQTCQKDPLAVSWIGISSDEAQRMKDSKVPYIVNRWPLIEKNMTRQDCLKWMKDHGYDEPPRSACTFCPFHSDDEWSRIKHNTPDEFEKVVQFERRLQAAARGQEALTGVPYLHETCVPIDQVKLEQSDESHKQVSKFGNECEGLCGV